MTTLQSLPDLSILNLIYLLKIQSDANKDAVQACYRYGMHRDEMARIRDIAVDRIAALAANLDQSLFSIRTELPDIADAPPALSGMLGSVRIPVAVSPASGAHPPTRRGFGSTAACVETRMRMLAGKGRRTSGRPLAGYLI